MTNPWDITRYEHDPLGGPDIAHFADGHRMPIKPRPPELTDYWNRPDVIEHIADLRAHKANPSANPWDGTRAELEFACLLTEDTDDEAFAALPECEHCDGTGKNLTGSPWERT